MMERIRRILALVGLARSLGTVNPDAEKDGVKRLGKGLVAAALVAIAKLLLTQTSEGCILGELACRLLKDPAVASILVAAILGAEKYLNEKFGLGLASLDSSRNA